MLPSIDEKTGIKYCSVFSSGLGHPLTTRSSTKALLVELVRTILSNFPSSWQHCTRTNLKVIWCSYLYRTEEQGPCLSSKRWQTPANSLLCQSLLIERSSRSYYLSQLLNSLTDYGSHRPSPSPDPSLLAPNVPNTE